MQVRLIDLIGVLSRALDLVSRTLGKHHAHVGCMAARMAGKMKLSPTMQRDVLLAGMLHDVGAVALHIELESLGFEKDVHTHARAGKLLFAEFAGLEDVAHIIGDHHTNWDRLLACGMPHELAVAAGIVNFVDFVDVRLDRGKPYGGQFAHILEAAKKESGRKFNPDCISLFSEMVAEPDALKGLFDPDECLYTDAYERLEQVTLNAWEVLGLCGLFAQVIDFRSRFTATHSRGVAVVAQDLARHFQFDVDGRQTMYVAGLLHDIGKLAVPNKLLEKPGKLDEDEFLVVQDHAMVGEFILGGVPGLELVCEWGTRHHERLDGSGYPMGRTAEQLSLGARIMQVADVFTAITEDRPYRAGMTAEQTVEVLHGLVESGALDHAVVQVLMTHFDEINEARVREQRRAKREYEAFAEEVRNASADEADMNLSSEKNVGVA